MIDVKTLAATLQVPVRDEALFRQALSHRSFCAEHTQYQNNERLEFLGDSVLGMVITQYIYREFPDMPEGALAKVRAAVVSAEALAEVARELHLGDHLLLGKGEAATGGSDKSSILADAMEAVFAAVYLQDGMEIAEQFVLRLLQDRTHLAAEGPGGHDYKTRLQESAAQRFGSGPKYRLTADGPDHVRVFTAVVIVGGREAGTGTGPSKKAAEQQAARAAWEHLFRDNNDQ